MLWLYTPISSAYTAKLSQLIQYYQRLGVQKYMVWVNLKAKNDPTVEIVREICRDYDVVIGSWYEEGRDTVQVKAARNAAISNHCHRSDWVINADCDEYQAYPCPLKELIHHCESNGSDHVLGHLVDRVSEEGLLAVYDPSEPIEGQYPMRCDFTKVVLKGNTNKVIMSRPWLTLCGGHHQLVDGAFGSPCPGMDVEVHHFKWDSEVLKRMAWRKQVWQKEGLPWWRETDRLERTCRQMEGELIYVIRA